MARHVPLLTLFSFFALMSGLLVVIPDGEWGPLLGYVPVLALLALILYKQGLKPIDPQFPASLFLLAFLLKLISSVVRYWIVVDLYDFRADAPAYHLQGQYVARFFKQFDFSVLETYQFRGEGTTNLVHITGLLYTVLPPSMPGSFLMFAGLAFSGSVLFYRAFRLALPEVDPKLYRLIIFFLPSVLFWPSSLGKEAWLFFNSAVVAYGLVKYIRQGRFSGLILIGLGLLLIFPIRPHIAAFMVLAIGGAYLLSIFGGRTTSRPAARIVAAGLVIGLGTIILPSASKYVGVGQVSLDEIETQYEYYQDNTTQGGSRYATYSIFTPMGLVMGTVTVLFRPFPWEAHNPQVMVSALEASVWLGLVWVRRRVFWSRMRKLRADPWLAFAALYALIMILAFTTFGNFGILVRQRTLFLPFFWILFA